MFGGPTDPPAWNRIRRDEIEVIASGRYDNRASECAPYKDRSDTVGVEIVSVDQVEVLALADLSEGLNRGWGNRDSRSIMVLQTERAGVEIKVDPQRLSEAMEQKLK